MTGAGGATADGRRFTFGENWASFAGQLDEADIDHSAQSLLRLVPREELADARMIDIGCGSGLHAAAASRLGVRSILAIDFDPVAVETASKVLAAHARDGVQWSAERLSVFDLDPATYGHFDVVYAWGVLHHTGDMFRAIERAASLAKPGALFAFALYRRTSAPMDWLWTTEKRWYAAASPRAQSAARRVFVAAMRLGYRLKGTTFDRRAADYGLQRGAEIMHDIHDWMGGYPYEAISPAEVESIMHRLGFELVRRFTQAPGLGLFGSGCDEYVYRRRAH